MAAKQKEADVHAALPLVGMKLTKAELTAEEDAQDKALRRHKDRLGFYVKDVGVPAFAALVVLAMAGCSFWIALRSGFTPAEKEWARAALSAIAGGAVGAAFGKQLGKS
jgi:hypothetical protein